MFISSTAIVDLKFYIQNLCILATYMVSAESVCLCGVFFYCVCRTCKQIQVFKSLIIYFIQWQLYGHTAGDSFKIKQEKVKVKPKETSNYPEKSEKPTLLSLTVSDSTSNSPESKNMKLYTEKENKIR